MIYSCTKLFCLVRTELEQHNVFRILTILDANLKHDCKCYVPISQTLTSTPLLLASLCDLNTINLELEIKSRYGVHVI